MSNKFDKAVQNRGAEILNTGKEDGTDNQNSLKNNPIEEKENTTPAPTEKIEEKVEEKHEEAPKQEDDSIDDLRKRVASVLGKKEDKKKGHYQNIYFSDENWKWIEQTHKKTGKAYSKIVNEIVKIFIDEFTE